MNQALLWSTAADAFSDGIGAGVQLLPSAGIAGADSGPSGYGAGINNQAERYADMARRGTADLSLGNLARAGMMMANIAGPIGALKTAASLVKNPDPYTGFEKIEGTPTTLAEYNAARRAARSRVDARRSEQRGPSGGYGGSYGANDPTSKGPGGTLGHIADGGVVRRYANGGIADAWRTMFRPQPAAPTTLMDRLRAMRPVRPIASIDKPIDPTVVHNVPVDHPPRPRKVGGWANGGIVGAVRHASPGRADKVDTRAAEGTYIVPADVVSTLGQGNTEAGVKWLDGKVKQLLAGDAGALGLKRGGAVRKVPVRLSGGEYAVPAEAVTVLGRGSYEHGARKLEALIAQVRQGAARAMAGMPRPHR